MSARRHYSWPFSSSTKAQELPLPYLQQKPQRQQQRQRHPFTSFPSSSSLQQYRLQRKRPISSLKDTFNRPLSPDTLTFPYSSSDEEDVFVSAGIIASKEKPRRRRTSKRRRRSRHGRSTAKRSRQKKEDPEKPENNSEARKEERKEEEEVIVSSITEANHLPSAMLRRIIQPRLEKAKQFLIPSHLHFSSSPATTMTKSLLPIRGRQEKKIVLSCASTPVLPTSRLDDMIMDLPAPMMPEEWGFRPGRRHRRCHSEQPRAWREPSPGLWTLIEE